MQHRYTQPEIMTNVQYILKACAPQLKAFGRTAATSMKSKEDLRISSEKRRDKAVLLVVAMGIWIVTLSPLG